MSEAGHLRVDVAAGHRERLVGHVDADDGAGGTDEPRREVRVAAGATSQVEDGAPIDGGRDRRTAAVRPLQDLRMNEGERFPLI